MRPYREETIKIERPDGTKMKVLVLTHQEVGSAAQTAEPAAKKKMSDRHIGILWLHGGGYQAGMPKLVYMSAAMDLVRTYNVTLFVPAYRLSGAAPYPAALDDAYLTLLYMKEHADELDIRPMQLFVGGESAGGGLTAALCMKARDEGKVKIAFQMPLYPMLDDRDTNTSENNNGVFWNTKKNHKAWRKYLRDLYPKKVTQEEVRKLDIPPYAAPGRQKNYRDLPPCYTFVARGEPFYQETLRYIYYLRKAGVEAKIDQYDVDEHAFDMMLPFLAVSETAREKFVKYFDYAARHFRTY